MEKEKKYRIYDKQRGEYREEEHENKTKLMEYFRDHWYHINYDSEYEDIINSDLGEDATTEEVEKVMHQRVYGIPAERYLSLSGFEVREV